MTAQFLVKRIETCKYCDGKGFYPDPEWQELLRRYNIILETIGDPGDLKWDRLIKETWTDRHLEIPPEESWCVECEGEGETVSWASLQDALLELEATSNAPS